MVNWEACIKCGPIKGRRIAQWSPPPLSVLKFNVDEATRGKPGPTGIGGVLRNNKGEVLFRLSKNVGVCDSNEAEVLTIMEALKFLSRNFNGSLIVETDSSKAMASGLFGMKPWEHFHILMERKVGNNVWL